jgi:pimeloyl-ACP methyl ester carboxylesterase
VILLHAFPLDGGMWGDLSGRRLDYPGAGSLADWADTVAAQMEEPDVVCGLSMGGYAAFELARRHPDLVAGLVLADTRPGVDPPDARARRDEHIALVEREGVAALWERLRPALLAADAEPAVAARARSIAVRQPPGRVVAMLRALRDRRDSTDVVPGIRVPVLVICGEHDTTTPPAEACALAAALPDGRYAEIAGAGHLSAIERPAQFAAAVAQLSGS